MVSEQLRKNPAYPLRLGKTPQFVFICRYVDTVEEALCERRFFWGIGWRIGECACDAFERRCRSPRDGRRELLLGLIAQLVQPLAKPGGGTTIVLVVALDIV